jgi:hypothetical protein
VAGVGLGVLGGMMDGWYGPPRPEDLIPKEAGRGGAENRPAFDVSPGTEEM